MPTLSPEQLSSPSVAWARHVPGYAGWVAWVAAGTRRQPRCSTLAARRRQTIYRESGLPGLPGGNDQTTRRDSTSALTPQSGPCLGRTEAARRDPRTRGGYLPQHPDPGRLGRHGCNPSGSCRSSPPAGRSSRPHGACGHVPVAGLSRRPRPADALRRPRTVLPLSDLVQGRR